MRPAARHHYRGTKMALWLDLIPKLHQSDDLEPHQHLLTSWDNTSMFEKDGTDDLDMDFYFPAPTLAPVPTTPSSTTPSTTTTQSTTTTTRPTTPTTWWRPTWPPKTSAPSVQHTTEPPNMAGLSGKDGTLSLSVTIAVGCSLLFLNILIFAGVYYQKDRMRSELKARQRELEAQKAMADSDNPKSSSGPDCSDTNSSNMATPPVAPSIVSSRHQINPHMTSLVNTLPSSKHPIPVAPPQAPYQSRNVIANHRDIHTLPRDYPNQHTSPHVISPRHIKTLDRDGKLRHSPSADSGTDVNNHTGNPVTMV